ncbi:MAG: glycosyltransferase family 2 protein [Microscillaceae bacterium]|nr:glycosyltransferase family 2 protein [Microscillaceae bacterium]
MFSILIPTYNGAHKLVNLLEALTLQTDTDFETIILVDGSTDNTLELLQQNTWSLSALKVIPQANGGRALSRNRAAQAAEGNLLLFWMMTCALLRRWWPGTKHFIKSILLL